MKKISLILMVVLLSVAGLFIGCELQIEDPYVSEFPKDMGSMVFTNESFGDVSIYCYPQFGTYSISIDGGEAKEVSGAGAWWSGTDVNKSSAISIADGETKTISVTALTADSTMIIEAKNTNPEFYFDFNCYNDNDAWYSEGAPTGTIDKNLKAVCKNANEEYVFTINRVGSEITISVAYQGPKN